MNNAGSEDHRMPMRAVLLTAFAALALLVEGCSGSHPLYGADAVRDGMGRPVDATYGTPLPGTMSGCGGGGGAGM